MEPVPLLSTLAPGARIHPIYFPVKDGWSRFNPSIARSEDGFHCLVRSSTGGRRNGRFVISTGGFPVQNQNYLAIFDVNLQLRSVDLLHDETKEPVKFRSRFLGFEDLRLLPAPAGWQATATSKEHNPQDLNQQALLRLQGNTITEAVILSSTQAGNQKNWMPVLGASKPTLVLHCHPTTVISYDLTREFAETVAEHPAPELARSFRGGSQLVPVINGYVCVIHEMVPERHPRRLYLHRLVHFTNDFHIDAISQRFVFQRHEVEFCAGLAYHDDHFVFSFGENDAEAYLATVPANEFLSLLLPA